MTENFIIAAFHKMGEDPQTVRLMRNKYTGEPAGYCFVNFQSDDQAIDAMHKLNGKPIPGTNPIVRFRLNSASNSNKLPGNEREFSVWVGDLSSEVDDYSLYRAFSNKYSSIKTAKVILDSSGFSKGYGFVRFGLEEEQKSALFLMNGYVGLGTKPLKICNAVPKPKDGSKNMQLLLLLLLLFIIEYFILSSTIDPSQALPSNSYLSANTNSTSSASAADYTQYYDPTAYWQAAASTYSAATGTWPGFDQTQTDYAAYYQQQAATHIQQQNALAQQHAASNGIYDVDESLTLVGKLFH